MEENRSLKRVLYMDSGTTRLRGRPRNRWQDEVREDGWIVGGEGWQEKVHNREEWKQLLRTARNRRILHVPMEWMNQIRHYVSSLIMLFSVWEVLSRFLRVMVFWKMVLCSSVYNFTGLGRHLLSVLHIAGGWDYISMSLLDFARNSTNQITQRLIYMLMVWGVCIIDDM